MVLFYKGIVGNGTACYSLGVVQKARATLTVRNIKCYSLFYN